jgi:DNA repair protein RadA/Sms
VRPVAQAATRLKEAQKLGFARAVLPEAAREGTAEGGLALAPVALLANLVADIAATGRPSRTKPRRGEEQDG